jgi:hypothetical protein
MNAFAIFHFPFFVCRAASERFLNGKWKIGNGKWQMQLL